MTVLAIIGKVLLFLLLLILVLLLLVLFVPIRYEAHGAVDDPEGGEKFDGEKIRSELSGSFHFSWLFHAVSGGISYPENPDFVIRVLFFRIHLSGKKQDRKKKEEEKPDNEAQRQLDQDLAEKKKKGSRKETGTEKQPESRWESFLSKLEDLPDSIPDRLDKLEEKAEKKLRDLSFYWNLVEDPAAQDAVGRAVHTVVCVLAKILPKDWSISGTAGLGDPAATGQLLAVSSVLYPITGGHVFLTPEFSLFRLDLRAYAKGKIRLASVAAAAVKLFTDRDLKRLIRRIRHHRNRQDRHRKKGSQAAA